MPLVTPWSTRRVGHVALDEIVRKVLLSYSSTVSFLVLDGNAAAVNMSLVLNRRRIPEKAGSTRCPIENTIVARNPTVKACREAPQIPRT